MVLIVTLLLLVAVLAFVGYPLLQSPAAAPDDRIAPVAEQRAQLLAERENAVSALKDMEFEHGIGNLSDADYESLRSAQRHKAVAILGELERLDEATATTATADATAPASPPTPTDHPALDTRLEEEIARARQRLAQGAAEGATRDVEARDESG